MKERLVKYDELAVSQYARYVMRLQTENDKKTQQLKNQWAAKLSLDTWVAFFEKVAATGFYIDGENITIGSNGISLNYQAYKNLVIRKYPEAIFDIQLVREGDIFSFKKENGKIIYSHSLENPFNNEKYVGGYCIIKLRTGEFIELMSVKDLEQVRRMAKTDNIWAAWTGEMYLKTLIKRACKRHFKDAVEALDRMDNDNYELPDSQSEALATDTQRTAIMGLYNKLTEAQQDNFNERTGGVLGIRKADVDKTIALLNKSISTNK